MTKNADKSAKDAKNSETKSMFGEEGVRCDEST